MSETSVMYVSAQMSVNVFRIDAIAITIGISTAGSVPKTKSRMIERSDAADQRLREDARAAVAALRVVERVAPGEVRRRRPAGAAARSAARISSIVRRELKPGCPGG